MITRKVTAILECMVQSNPVAGLVGKSVAHVEPRVGASWERVMVYDNTIICEQVASAIQGSRNGRVSQRATESKARDKGSATEPGYPKLQQT